MNGEAGGRPLRLHPLQQELLDRTIASDRRVAVLVVEDDPDQGELVLRALERQSFTAALAVNGAECLEAAAQSSFEIVLLDYSLPGMNGLQVLAELRRGGVETPVVMVTAQGDEQLAIQAMKAGSLDFIVKTSGYLTALPTVLHKVLKQHELALENRRLYDEVRRRLQQAEALVALAPTLTATLELSPLLATIGQAAARAAGMERCAVLRLEGEEVQLLASQFDDGRRDERVSRLFQGFRMRVADMPFVSEVLKRREAVVINDCRNDPLYPPSLIPVRPQALLALPLLRQGAAVGVIVFERVTGGGPIEPAEVTHGATVAGQVSLALENARLYREAQQTLRDLQEAQEQLVRGETLRALGELASGVAHHLNNLLAVIAGRAQLLLRATPEAGQRRPIEIIDKAARDGAEVVRRIQEFARTRQAEERAPVDLNELANDVVEMTRPRWHNAALAQGHTITVACDLAAVPRIAGHAAALREVVMNLVLNAVDAVPDGGRIAIRTWVDEQGVALSVADTGVGMSEEVRRRAFEPFFTTKGVKSTGLGLSVNYGIVCRHGGDMRIESEEGQGTTITIVLPVSAEPSQDSGVPGCGGDRPLRIVVVDDEPAVREALADLIESEGHHVTSVPGPHEALSVLAAGPVPDLVITDLGMPGMTGWELARKVKMLWPGVPVGLITGWTSEVAQQSSSDGAVDFFFTKPLDMQHLHDALAVVRSGGGRPASMSGAAAPGQGGHEWRSEGGEGWGR